MITVMNRCFIIAESKHPYTTSPVPTGVVKITQIPVINYVYLTSTLGMYSVYPGLHNGCVHVFAAPPAQHTPSLL